MSRIGIWSAPALAGCGLFWLWGPSGAEPSPPPAGISSGGSLIGLLMGLLLGLVMAWLYGIEWSTVPERLSVWGKLQRRRLGWAMLGSICAAILLYF
jgi:hypothetical protein